MIAEHHEDRWAKLVFNWNPISTKQKGYRKQGRPDGRTTSTPSYNQTEPTETTTTSQQPAQPTTSTNTIYDNPTTTHDQTTYTATHPLSTNRWLNLRKTKTTTARTLVQKATRISLDALILSETQLLPSTDSSPRCFKQQEM